MLVKIREKAIENSTNNSRRRLTVSKYFGTVSAAIAFLTRDPDSSDCGFPDSEIQDPKSQILSQARSIDL